MSVIITIMLPILLLAAIGFAAVRTGLLQPPHVQGLAAFVLNFALPAVLLSALSRQDLTTTFNASYVLAYGAGSLVAFFAAFLTLQFAMGRSLDGAAIGGLGASASNTGFIGFPVASLAFGQTALIALPMTMLVENILILPLALALVEWRAGRGNSAAAIGRQTLSRLIRMPLIIAILVGTAMALAGLHFPLPVVKVLDMLAAASAPCALIVVGGTLALMKKGDVAADIAPITVGKLLVHPLAVTTGMLLIPGIPPELQAAGILLSSVSMITIYPLLAARAGFEGIATAALIVATTLALGTISVVLILLQVS